MTLKWFEVGYDDYFIGVYSGTTPEEAIKNCRNDIRESNFKVPPAFRLQKLSAHEICYV